MKKVIILGAGFAGLHIFYKIKKLIGSKIGLSIVDPRSHSLLKPSLPEVAFDGTPVSHSLIELRGVIESKGATFLQSAAVKIDPHKKNIELKDGEILSYDFLFITMGAIKDYEAIEGLEEYGYSVCDDLHAPKLWEAIKNFKGGHIVIGSAKSGFGTLVDAPRLSAPCEGPIGEAMFMSDYYLSNYKKFQRSKDFDITIFSPAKIFFEDVGKKPHEVVGKYMNELQMKLLTDKSIKKITKNEAIFEDGSSLPCDLAIIIPPYIAPKVILEANLGDDKGFVPTDSDMRHLEYRDIYAAGDITSLAQPKLGHISIIQAGVAANTFLKDIGEVDAKPPKDLSVFCIMNMGGVEATLINDNTLFGGSTSIAFHSPVARMMKWAFDNELYYTKGHMPPIWAMKMTNKIIDMV